VVELMTISIEYNYETGAAVRLLRQAGQKDLAKPSSPTATELEDFDDEEGYYKDLFHPDFDELPGETPISFRLRYVFTSNGYRFRHVEEVKTNPVLIVRVVRKDAPRITDQRLFFRHIQDLLRTAGFRLRKDELTIDQRGDRFMFAFLSGKPREDFRDILREREENPVDEPL
jgi:hypothetical protein